MYVSIYSLKKTIFEGEATALTCTTVSGEITILNNHRELITALAKGSLKITGTDTEKYVPLSGGFLEVQQGNRVRCIVEE